MHLLLRYTLQQQHQQGSRLQHTDAWLDSASTAGQRALQVNVGDDPKWVVIPSSGLQRNAANVGAGGMVKKNLLVGAAVPLPTTPALLLMQIICGFLVKLAFNATCQA